MQLLKTQLGFDCLFGIDSLGQSGGLCLFWKEDCNIRILSSSQSYIDSEIGGIGDPEHWRFTGFYGSLRLSNRHQSWNLLRQISLASSIPWAMGGDFKELLHSGEKLGGGARPLNQMLDFREAVCDCTLRDLGS
ncbi:hypothetical protein ACFXTH_046109 [Malus domestica]